VAFLVDIFGYFGILLHGLTIVAQSMTLGSLLFLICIARPFAPGLSAGPAIREGATRIGAWSAVGLAVVETTNVVLQAAVLVQTVDLSWIEVMGANFAVAGMVKVGAAVLIAALLFGTRLFRPRLFAPPGAPGVLLLALGAVELAAATMTTHAAARLSNSAALLVTEALHQFGAAIWIGGIPCFVMALSKLRETDEVRRVSARFSRMSMLGVGCIIASAAVMSIAYIGDWSALYGTAYGVMVGAKAVMFLGLLGLGFGNFLVTERLRNDPTAPVLRMRRFAEVEIAVGFTLFFTAASLTSVPPAVDTSHEDRATWQEVMERDIIPHWPRLASPEHDALAISELQAKVDAERAAHALPPRAAFVEGSGFLPPRNAADIAWSEYNHHWAGVFVVIIGLLALLTQAGVRIARHWPLLFLVLAAFLLLRSDPEVWPLGNVGWFESLRDPEVVQHRLFVLVIIIFGFFEWGVRIGKISNPRAALVFPLVTGVGAALLLTHNHQISNVKDALLIEFTHTPLALISVATAWARWLELRLPGRPGRIAGWVWPTGLVLVGAVLLLYREA
jgi:copper resistance protein D